MGRAKSRYPLKNKAIVKEGLNKFNYSTKTHKTKGFKLIYIKHLKKHSTHKNFSFVKYFYNCERINLKEIYF